MTQQKLMIALTEHDGNNQHRIAVLVDDISYFAECEGHFTAVVLRQLDGEIKGGGSQTLYVRESWNDIARSLAGIGTTILEPKPEPFFQPTQQPACKLD